MEQIQDQPNHKSATQHSKAQHMEQIGTIPEPTQPQANQPGKWDLKGI